MPLSRRRWPCGTNTTSFRRRAALGMSGIPAGTVPRGTGVGHVLARCLSLKGAAAIPPLLAATKVDPRGPRRHDRPAMPARWGWFRLPPLVIVALLLIGTQAVFLWASLYRDLGNGLQAASASLDNYVLVLGDPFYLGVLWQSVLLSAAAATFTI